MLPCKRKAVGSKAVAMCHILLRRLELSGVGMAAWKPRATTGSTMRLVTDSTICDNCDSYVGDRQLVH